MAITHSGISPTDAAHWQRVEDLDEMGFTTNPADRAFVEAQHSRLFGEPSTADVLAGLLATVEADTERRTHP